MFETVFRAIGALSLGIVVGFFYSLLGGSDHTASVLTVLAGAGIFMVTYR